ncbi:MAG: glycosyl transferase family 2 [Bacteroidetes bacterium]|nr:glycosyl transferase family 2 [Bacteroidota bacterium]
MDLSETNRRDQRQRGRTLNVSDVTLSIVIPNWNGQKLIRDLLSSIQAHPPPSPYEVIVVDNGSTDGSIALIEREFPEVHLIMNSSNLGYARANNQGYAASAGRFVLLLGNDTVMLDRSVERMVEYLDKHTDVGAVACRLLNPDGTLQGSCKRFPRLRDAALTYLSLHRMATRYNMRGFDYYQTQEVEQPAATCLMIRRAVIEQIGLFDERYTILYNDVDLCRRIWAAGWKIVFVGDAEIIHHGSYSTLRSSPALRLEMYRNIMLYYEGEAGLWARVILLPILTMRLFAVLKSPVAFKLLFTTGYKRRS